MKYNGIREVMSMIADRFDVPLDSREERRELLDFVLDLAAALEDPAKDPVRTFQSPYPFLAFASRNLRLETFHESFLGPFDSYAAAVEAAKSKDPKSACVIDLFKHHFHDSLFTFDVIFDGWE